MLLERSCPTQLKRRPHHNSKVTLSHLPQLKRNPESPTAIRPEPYAVTRKEPQAIMTEKGPTKIGEDFPAKT